MRKLACAGLLAVFLACDQSVAEAQSSAEEPRGSGSAAAAPPEPELPVPLAAGSPAVPVAPAMITRDTEGRGHRARRSRGTAPPDRRRAERGALHHGGIALRLHPGGAAAWRPGDGEDGDLGVVRQQLPVHLRPDVGHRARQARGHRDAPRQQYDVPGQRRHLVHLRHVLRPAERGDVHGQSDRRALRRARSPANGSSTRTGTRCGSSRPGASSSGWTAELAIPFKSLRYQPGTAQVWGFNAHAHQALQERDVAADEGAARPSEQRRSCRRATPPPSSGFRRHREDGISTSSRTRSRASPPIASPRPACPTIPSGDVGLDLKYTRHPGAGRGRDRQHRLRAGRGRRAAGQPHPLQPVLPGEARVLPGEPGHVRLRRRAARRQLQRPEQQQRHGGADPVLQPPHRPESGARRAAGGGRPA